MRISRKNLVRGAPLSGLLSGYAALALAPGLVAPRYRRTGAVVGAAALYVLISRLTGARRAAVAPRVGTALVVREVHAETWRPRIDGERTR